MPNLTQRATHRVRDTAQTALFVKRLFLIEERAVLTAVPFLLDPHASGAAELSPANV